ncbi:phosphoadenylyl-sulfate reductase [uncultured Maricaulis sp.]|uniref:phosphoadenylyl-sulfate reductase n=1 Tax=uncultured Maricaulis sp. TaxID=174710 RepID=UPI0030D70EEC|tara:strand:- start:101753 stop:102841 length:1089 start_codon:yes stop_codon:yes gene_type:complete
MLRTNPATETDRSALAQLASGGGKTVELSGGADWRTAAEDIRGAVQVDIRFASFKDGRGFSLATQLRTRLGYSGRLRAIGDLIPDQAQFLKRVGFDAITPDRSDLAADWANAERRYSVVYQPAHDAIATIPALRKSSSDELEQFNARYRNSDALEILHDALETTWRGRIALLSSFGTEAAVSLHLASRINPATPVLFLDTGRHFAQTEQYLRTLVDRLKLTDVRVLKPDTGEVQTEDADGYLWQRDADACCAMRKVRPLSRALDEFDALVTGRKRFHGGARTDLPVVERVADGLRVNPLANWSAEQIQAYFQAHDLPRHPLADMGYSSIGCWTCTAPAYGGGGLRAGRWPGQNKTECGIHAR